MILIIRGNGKSFLVRNLHNIIGPTKSRYIDDCSDYELRFVYDNHQDASVVLILAVVDGVDIEPWVHKFEKKFNVPVCIAGAVNLWR